jgi:hypothetical protein
MFVFKHPKYYKELRKLRNKSDQAISCVMTERRLTSGRATGPGPKPQASSSKPQATSSQASSGKRQAPSCKHQASSRKRQAP